MLTIFHCIAIWSSLPAEAVPFFDLLLATIAERRVQHVGSASTDPNCMALDDGTIGKLVERLSEVIETRIVKATAPVRHGPHRVVAPTHELKKMVAGLPSGHEDLLATHEARVRDDAERLAAKIEHDLGGNFSTTRLAKSLGMHRNEILELIRTGRLRASQPRRKYIISAWDAAECLARGYARTDSKVLRLD